MKVILIFALLSLSITLLGQTDFNYGRDFKPILLRTKDAKDDLSYDKLLKRFSQNDTTLTDFEVLALMIGFTSKPAYLPYSDLEIEREIYKLNDQKKYKEGLAMADSFLMSHPVSVNAIFEKSYSFHKLLQKDSAEYYAYQGNRIFEAMYYSGNGKTKEHPTFALGPADGQDYIRKFVRARIGDMGSGSDDSGYFLDILEAKFEDGDKITLFFIIQHAIDKIFDRK